ncbi:Dicarboxylate transport [Kosakonia oryzendophytica]|uniref:Dicarboxylate transport n=1 Tax=Kosakonia oryzendophytica TaxID=1005665 RepID=A0A1C4BLA1_9ENTR|nr:YdbH family protein [Kosakonia oryzendophytica]SCC07452.1 Dicarboxylate transport [Kosakonia oryzendophytica]
MKGKYKAAIALVLLFILLPLTLLLTLAYWVPTLAGIWLPSGTRIAMETSPRLTRHALKIPDLRYLVGDCQLAQIKNAELTHPSRWQLHIASLDIDSACLNALPASESSSAPRTLAQWQSMLPYTWLTVDRVTLSPWQTWQGKLQLALTPALQTLNYTGDRVEVSARLRGQALTVKRLAVRLFDDQPPLTLGGEFTLPEIPQGVPVNGHIQSTLTLPQQPGLVDTDLEWRNNEGQLVVMARDGGDPLLDLPWQLTRQQLTISDGRWNWPYEGFPLSGRVGLKIENWQQGLENALFSGRLNVLTQGDAGKGNAVLTIGPGRLSMDNSEMPLQLTGEAKQGDLVFYAVLPARLSGALDDPQLAFTPGALLRSRGRVIDSLNIDEVRWPLAGVKLTQRGIDGRLQAILRAHENAMGDFRLHLDGQARDFLPDDGLWRWRYWGDGHFTPMNARWDVTGHGEWKDNAITLTALSTGFDQLQYGGMRMTTPRLALDAPVRWIRDAENPQFDGALTLDAGQTTFSGGSVLPPSRLKFRVEGTEPTLFQFKGDLRADTIGPVQVNGRWDGERLRGQAWWPRQSLTVFQPLIPPDWKMKLLDGALNAQVAFSAAAGQGFAAGGHGVLKSGSVWTPDNEIRGVDFVLPFRYRDATWQLGTRRPVSLRIGEIVNQVTAKNFTADLQGAWPWSEGNPLILSDVSVDALGGKITMQQLRMPQHDPALLRLNHISSSELISAVNPKQFALSGPFDGALPLWLDNPQWIIKDGWLHNPGPMTLRIDKDTADAVVNDNMAAGAAINWLRYMEISRSWTRINLDNLGVLTMQATLGGTSFVEGKSSTVNLNYTHEENVFTLWRSLRFGDNLQSWLEQNAALPEARCAKGEVCEERK